MKFSSIFTALFAAFLCSCGGGSNDENISQNIELAFKNSSNSSLKLIKSSSITSSPASAVIYLYQAFYGKAPSYADYTNYLLLATIDSALLANTLALNFVNMSDGNLAKLILTNLSITEATVTQVGSYAALLSAVEQIFAAYGNSSRGQIILNVTNLLKNLDADKTFGSAATTINKQAATNYTYSTASTSIVASATAGAEGAWTGSTSTGYGIDVLVLEDSSYWAMYGIRSTSAFYIVGFDAGTGTLSGSKYTGILKEYLYNKTQYTGSISANIVTGLSMSGSAAYSNGASATFSLATLPSTNYSYLRPALISEISGSWSGYMLDGVAAVTTISSVGFVSGSSAGCSFTGTVAPRSSSKNVFDVAITFGGSPCLLPLQSVSGIALDYITTSNKRQLLVAVEDTTKTFGTMFFAQR